MKNPCSSPELNESEKGRAKMTNSEHLMSAPYFAKINIVNTMSQYSVLFNPNVIYNVEKVMTHKFTLTAILHHVNGVFFQPHI